MRDEIDDCKYLYLRELWEPEENTLRVVVEEAKSDGPPEDIEIAGKVISGTRPIGRTTAAGCSSWSGRLTSHTVSATSCIPPWDDSEVWDGRLFRVYSKSHSRDMWPRRHSPVMAIRPAYRCRPLLLSTTWSMSLGAQSRSCGRLDRLPKQMLQQTVAAIHLKSPLHSRRRRLLSSWFVGWFGRARRLRFGGGARTLSPCWLRLVRRSGRPGPRRLAAARAIRSGTSWSIRRR